MLVAKKQSDKGEVGAMRMSMLGVGSGLPMTAFSPESLETPWPPRTAPLRAGSGSRETERPFGALLAPEGRWTFILLRVDTPRLATSSSYRRKPVSRGSDWIPCQARNDGPEQKTIPRSLPRRAGGFLLENTACPAPG